MSLADIRYGSSMVFQQRSQLEHLMEAFASVFATDSRAPPPMHNVSFAIHLREGAHPPHTPVPRWGEANATLLSEWARTGLESGLLEYAEHPRWVSRPHIVMKHNGEVTGCVAIIVL